MVEPLTDEQLNEFEEHAKRSWQSRNPRPLLADRIEMLVADARRLREALNTIRDTHQPLDADDRLCAEGCSGSWPCSTRLEADHALGNPRPQSR